MAAKFVAWHEDHILFVAQENSEKILALNPEELFDDMDIKKRTNEDGEVSIEVWGKLNLSNLTSMVDEILEHIEGIGNV